ncbi:MAG TPA: COX15/CtaA family protein [Cyclobacteriaceae bacterium]
MSTTAIRAFHKLSLSTLIAVYILIAVGGIVRTTGSGMGCPDWPRCFGQWVPPTSERDLPANYKETYSAHRDKKNQKFIKYLRAFGMNETADQLASDKSVLVETNFNATRTWIEYLNRLTGAVIGLFIIALVVRSWPLRKTRKSIFILSVITLIGVIFQGWFGSIVVSTNLTTWTITVHMLLAMVIVALLIYLYHLSETQQKRGEVIKGLKAVLIGCMALLLIQVVLGTEVRAAIDRISMSGIDRSSWIGMLGSEFITHRTFSWIVLIAHVILMVQIMKTKGSKALPRALFILILCTLLTGAGMAYFNIPAFLQPVHLLIATVTFGLQLMMLFRLTDNKKVVSE